MVAIRRGYRIQFGKKSACYCGIAPFEHSSGRKDGILAVLKSSLPFF
ncbi:hypothetical protein [Rhodoflexus sp.]